MAEDTTVKSSIVLCEALSEKLRALYRRDPYEIHDRLLVFHETLKARYPDFQDYRLVHLVSGSTFKERYAKFDFPPPNSVEEFISAEWRTVWQRMKTRGPAPAKFCDQRAPAKGGRPAGHGATLTFRLRESLTVVNE